MSGPVLLRLDRVSKRDGPDPALIDASAAFRQGEMTVVLGGRDEALTMLGALIGGQRLADSGSIWRGGTVAPPIGSAWGFGVTGSTERDLALRAAAYGLHTADYVNAVAGLLARPQELHLPFAELGATDRYTVLFGAGYLIPAQIYVIGGAPIPIAPGAWGEIEALFESVRPRSTMIWLAGGVTLLRRFDPQQYATLIEARLTLHGGKDSALTAFARESSRSPQV